MVRHADVALPSGRHIVVDAPRLSQRNRYVKRVLLNGKHSDQQTLLDALTQIHTALTKRNDFSDFSTTDAQVLSIMTTSSPQIIGREQNNQWIAGSSFEVSFYWR